MCILCVIQNWSRRTATMLPWLVIPLVGLWAMSQLFPPAFRFEITSPRLACVMVLLVTLFWYEILMPKLSVWRAKRNAMHLERMRFEAIELQKLRKTATRRCRNCLTAYRDQNPGGGKFMCSYCGHISKRPVLDLPVPPEACNSGILKDLMGKSGRMLNGNVCSENGWMCGQDWMENGKSPPFSVNSNNWKKNCDELFGTDEEHYSTGKSYSRVSVFACKLLTLLLLIWRKLFRVSSYRDDILTDADYRGVLENSSENGGIMQESRGDKARRKAEEKRLAKLEKELLEEEEKKQREEVAKLIEERRKLRVEKLESVKECGKGSANANERDYRRESNKKRLTKMKEKDRGSSKSNSDAEELEKRVSKESDRNKKVEKRFLNEGSKNHQVESGSGIKTAVSNQSKVNDGTRYLDRMRGKLLSSSFTGSGFFGKTTSASTISREHKPGTLLENSHIPIRKEVLQQECASGRSSHNTDVKILNSNVSSQLQPSTASKQSWIHLFHQSPRHSTDSDSVNEATVKYETEAHDTSFTGHDSSKEPVNFGPSSAFHLPSLPFGVGTSSVVTKSPEAVLPKTGLHPHQFPPEDSDIFEDPCYIPDPISLLGPVSESLDNFHLDVGFASDRRPEKPEITRPSPIESPLSRSRVSVERESNFHSTPKASNNLFDSNEVTTWEIWNNSPSRNCGTGIDLIGGRVSWLIHPEMNKPTKEESVNPAVVDDPWLRYILSEPNHRPENRILVKNEDDCVEHSIKYRDSSGSVVGNHQFEVSSANSWANGTDRAENPRPGNSLPISRHHIGGLFSPPDVPSLWSFD